MNQLETSLLFLFAHNRFTHTDARLLQPVEAFLDLSGEDIRRRLYLTTDADGLELCLRPEYTIPVAREYIASDMQGERAEFSYCGPVFRHRSHESGEFVQAGIESFGRKDTSATDGEVLALAVETAKLMGVARPVVKTGDVSLIEAFSKALQVPAASYRRLMRMLAANRPYRDAFAPSGEQSAQNGLSAYQGVLTALKGTDPIEARAFVKDLLSIAGINSVGGRSTADIATRFLAQSDAADTDLGADSHQILDRFLSLEGNPDTVSADLRKLSLDAGLDLNQALDEFDARTGFIAASGVDIAGLVMQTRFIRNLDYYSGFVFEIESPLAGKPLIAGGRYDRLLGRLGARHDIPAIGFSSWLDRSAA